MMRYLVRYAVIFVFLKGDHLHQFILFAFSNLAFSYSLGQNTFTHL